MMLLQGPSDGATPDYGICVAPTWQQMLAARTGERRRLALPLLAVRNFEKRRGNTKLPDPSFLKEAVNDGAVHYYAGRAQWFSLRPRDPSLLDQLEELELVDHSSSIAFGDSFIRPGREIEVPKKALVESDSRGTADYVKWLPDLHPLAGRVPCLAGEHDRAKDWFHRDLGAAVRKPIQDRGASGQVPQGFPHVGLINAAWRLGQAANAAE